MVADLKEQICIYIIDEDDGEVILDKKIKFSQIQNINPFA